MARDTYPAIGDYALIGDGRTCALVAKDGSIDWLCLPQFGSPSMFAALLDRREGGRFVVKPRGAAEVERRYRPGTNVLETTFRTAGGVVRLTDAFAIPTTAERQRELLPDQWVMRRIDCLEGTVDVELLCAPRPNYARDGLHVRDDGIAFVWPSRHCVCALRAELPLEFDDARDAVVGSATLRAGESARVSLGWEASGPVVYPPLGGLFDHQLEFACGWWERWTDGIDYNGPYRDAVVRSALALRLLQFPPSGAIIAAPTTSLPESPGGSLNWDYRFCWLRDASLTMRALLGIELPQRAAAFFDWMLYATRLTWPELQVVYTVHGETNLKETELDRFEGWRGSAPVRIGNAAHDQKQLDIYGEVVSAAYDFVKRGGDLNEAEHEFLIGLGKTVCDQWKDPDEGIWEPRGGPKQHTHSKAMCWVALDSLVRMQREGLLEGVPVDEFEAARDEIAAAVREHGWNDELGSYTTDFGGDDVDASLLLLGLTRFEEPDSERMRGTMRVIHERLAYRGLLYRYTKDQSHNGETEGTFTLCGLWWSEINALVGEVDEARRQLERVLECANDVGLLSEEIDADTNELLGNFPQTISHLGVITAALAIEAAQKGAKEDTGADAEADAAGVARGRG